MSFQIQIIKSTETDFEQFINQLTLFLIIIILFLMILFCLLCLCHMCLKMHLARNNKWQMINIRQTVRYAPKFTPYNNSMHLAIIQLILKQLWIIEWNSPLFYVRIDRLTLKQWKSILKAMTLLIVRMLKFFAALFIIFEIPNKLIFRSISKLLDISVKSFFQYIE